MDFFALVPSTSIADANNAAYSCTLTNTWSAATHPIGYDAVESSAHWSPPVLVAHNADYDLWTPGGLASPGVENVAEIGVTSTLENELETSRGEGMVAEFVIGENQFNDRDPPQTLRDIHLNATFPFLSAITMVAPSPDWFTGITKFSPISDEGFWYESFGIATAPYDAGTEQGDTFSIGNSAEEEHLPISQFTVETVPDSGILLDPSGTTVLPMITWSCVLQPSTSTSTSTSTTTSTTTITNTNTDTDTDTNITTMEELEPEVDNQELEPEVENQNVTTVVVPVADDNESVTGVVVPPVDDNDPIVVIDQEIDAPEPDSKPIIPEDVPVPDLEQEQEVPQKCSRYFDACTENAQCCSAACDRGKCAGRSRVDGRGEGMRISNQGTLLGGAAGRSRRSGNVRQLGAVPVAAEVLDEQQKVGGRLRGFLA